MDNLSLTLYDTMVYNPYGFVRLTPTRSASYIEVYSAEEIEADAESMNADLMGSYNAPGN